MLKVLYEDTDLLVAVKPAGLESQSSRRLEPDMVSEIKKYLSTKISTNRSTQGKEPYVGVIHRLDKPVGGVMVYAKNRKAAAALSRQVQEQSMKKIYHAVICGQPVEKEGSFVDYLLKDGKTNTSKVVDKDTKEAKRAELSYRVLAEKEDLSLVEIELKTGRHHQIRAQFAAHKTPLFGDRKYNPQLKEVCEKRNGDALALAAVKLSFVHPTTKKRMEFSIKAQGGAFRLFSDADKT